MLNHICSLRLFSVIIHCVPLMQLTSVWCQTLSSLLLFQWIKKRMWKSRRIPIEKFTRLLTPRPSSSTRKTLSRTGRGSPISSSRSAANPAVETVKSSCCIEMCRHDAPWTDVSGWGHYPTAPGLRELVEQPLYSNPSWLPPVIHIYY